MNERSGLRAQVAARVGRLSLDVELDTGAGTLVIVGPNGAGKTSLLSLLLGALPMERGRVEVAREVLVDTEAGVELPLELRRLGYVPQDYALFPHMTVRENLDFALSSGARRMTKAERRERAAAVLKELGLEALVERHPASLSGGEKQRVALARALSVSPRALLLDEPLSALDAHTRREVRGVLARYLDQLELPTLVVTHDVTDARVLGQRIAVLEDGRLTQVGTWEELVGAPASRFVEELVASSSVDPGP